MWDFEAEAPVELLACWERPFAGTAATTGEQASLFCEGLLSAERDPLQSGACATCSCCELPTRPWPLSPELVLPDSLFNLEGRPLLLSWGLSEEVLPGLRLTWPPI